MQIPVEALSAPSGEMSEQFHMAARPGSHVAYASGSDLVVDWYDFGEHAPYESVNLLIFDQTVQPLLAEAIGADPSLATPMLAKSVAAYFSSYFEVRKFAEERLLPFDHKVSFDP